MAISLDCLSMLPPFSLNNGNVGSKLFIWIHLDSSSFALITTPTAFTVYPVFRYSTGTVYELPTRFVRPWPEGRTAAYKGVQYLVQFSTGKLGRGAPLALTHSAAIRATSHTRILE